MPANSVKAMELCRGQTSPRSSRISPSLAVCASVSSGSGGAGPAQIEVRPLRHRLQRLRHPVVLEEVEQRLKPSIPALAGVEVTRDQRPVQVHAVLDDQRVHPAFPPRRAVPEHLQGDEVKAAEHREAIPAQAADVAHPGGDAGRLLDRVDGVDVRQPRDPVGGEVEVRRHGDVVDPDRHVGRPGDVGVVPVRRLEVDGEVGLHVHHQAGRAAALRLLGELHRLPRGESAHPDVDRYPSGRDAAHRLRHREPLFPGEVDAFAGAGDAGQTVHPAVDRRIDVALDNAVIHVAGIVERRHHVAVQPSLATYGQIRHFLLHRD